MTKSGIIDGNSGLRFARVDAPNGTLHTQVRLEADPVPVECDEGIGGKVIDCHLFGSLLLYWFFFMLKKRCNQSP